MLLTCTELAEVFCGPRHDFIKEFEVDSPFVNSIDFYIKVNLGALVDVKSSLSPFIAVANQRFYKVLHTFKCRIEA